ncbi:hypothetical protein [uncultured Microbacterium sp.]|uniref:Uncharacterized protein n=1 Tax=uncultured Microbacterium sp. TaxID=191216 RepID=A0A1Y5NWU2_9MICO|nr:hypothetical protein [uncultured Microbacterium sp.]SBS70864.1 conserved hypothetical protein [uncultured Microbacterium sp.]
MSTPDQPETPQLTRRQLREIRNTAATPIITPDMQGPATGETPVTDVDVETPDPAPAPAPVAPLPRAAVPVDIPEAPIADSAVDLGGHALTRRAVRQQERLRTAAIAIQPGAPADEESPAEDSVEELVAERDAGPEEAGSTGPITAVIEAEPVADEEDEPAPAEEPLAEASSEEWAEPATEREATEQPAPDEDASAEEHPSDEWAEEPPSDEWAEPAPSEDPQVAPAEDLDAAASEESAPAPAAPGAAFGLGRTNPDAEVDIEISLPASFDQMLPRSGNGGASLSTANALILSQTPETGSLVSPVAATGEVLITGTFALPDTYGSTGRVPGSAEGKDVDAVLLDGELPSASSPTPIAASAAVSTIKSAEDIIRPPAPEKGSKLMMALAITAGVLALALAGVLILAFVTGVF